MNTFLFKSVLRMAFGFSIFTIQNASGQITLNLHLLIEGYYSAGGMMDNYGAGGCLYVNGISPNSSDADTIIVSLADPSNLNIVESQKGILQTNGTLSLNFTQASLWNSYYIRIRHRNSIETWSALPVSLQPVTVYDFARADSMASGKNMKESFDHHGWMIYSGDISDANNLGLGLCYQDGVVDPQDYLDMENALALHTQGYGCADITGDGIVDTTDYIIEEDAVRAIRFAIQPKLVVVNEIESMSFNSPVIKCISLDGKLNFDKEINLEEKDFHVFNLKGEDFGHFLYSTLRISDGLLPNGIYFLCPVN